jgi:hypothetical protein
MNEKDKEMFKKLLEDKGNKYRVVIDNDSVWIEEKNNEEDPLFHNFNEFGYYLLQQILAELGIDAEMC